MPPFGEPASKKKSGLDRLRGGHILLPIVSNPNFLTLAEAAEIARVSPSTVRSWVREGRLASSRPGRRILIEHEVLVTFLRGEKLSNP